MAPGSNDDLVMAFKYLMDRERLLKGWRGAVKAAIIAANPDQT